MNKWTPPRNSGGISQVSTRFSLSRLTRDGTAEPISRDQILRHARGQGNIDFPCSADHEQDWQPYPVDPYSALCDDLSRARSLRNLLVSGNECGRVFPAGVGPGSPSRDAANWLPSRFSLSVETRRRYGWLRMMVFPGARLFPSPNLVPFGRVAARERQGALSRRAW